MQKQSSIARSLAILLANRTVFGQSCTGRFSIMQSSETRMVCNGAPVRVVGIFEYKTGMVFMFWYTGPCALLIER